MPTCENCHTEWTWKETVKKTFIFFSEMKCPYCGEKQYITQKSKMKNFFPTMFVLSPLLLNIFFDIPGVILLSLFPILFIIVLLIYAFLVEISNTDPFGYKP